MKAQNEEETEAHKAISDHDRTEKRKHEELGRYTTIHVAIIHTNETHTLARLTSKAHTAKQT
jgi:hypothetical protein